MCPPVCLPACLQVKITTRRAFGQLPALALVQLLHGLARMPRYAPNPGWLLAFTKAVRPQLQNLPAGEGGKRDEAGRQALLMHIGWCCSGS